MKKFFVAIILCGMVSGKLAFGYVTAPEGTLGFGLGYSSGQNITGTLINPVFGLTENLEINLGIGNVNGKVSGIDVSSQENGIGIAGKYQVGKAIFRGSYAVHSLVETALNQSVTGNGNSFGVGLFYDLGTVTPYVRQLWATATASGQTINKTSNSYGVIISALKSADILLETSSDLKTVTVIGMYYFGK